MSLTLNQWTEKLYKHSFDAGWWDGVDVDQAVPTKLCLIHSEISEAMEGHRKNLMDTHLTHRPMIEVELADAFIRIADLVGALGLNLEDAVIEKHNYNQTRSDHKIENRLKAGGKKY